ncbi:MAG: ABC transporter ATP-binding protein [Nitrospinota bacterium]
MGNDTIIEAIGLTKSFGNKLILDGVNLSIKRGESMVILGGSGSGKSVFIKHIIGLLEPDSGKVLVEGEEVAKMGQKKMNQFRKKFGMLFQNGALFDSMTIGENVGFALKEHTDLSKTDRESIVKSKLALVGLFDVENSKPAELSGGMKKRVGLARAIAMDPEIILYDEPTTGLDPITADQINDLISSLQKEINVTTVTITHDMVSANRIADRVAFLYKGKFVATGSADDVFNSRATEVADFCYIGRVLRKSEIIQK